MSADLRHGAAQGPPSHPPDSESRDHGQSADPNEPSPLRSSYSGRRPVQCLGNGCCRPLLGRYDPQRRRGQQIGFYRKPSGVFLVDWKDRNQLDLLEPFDREGAGGLRWDNSTPLCDALDLQFIRKEEIRFSASPGFGRGVVHRASPGLVDFHGLRQSALSDRAGAKLLLHAYHMLM